MSKAARSPNRLAKQGLQIREGSHRCHEDDDDGGGGGGGGGGGR